MPELHFRVIDVQPARYAAAPLLYFKLGITELEAPPRPIQSIALRCQLRLEPARRRYSAPEQEKLGELFGAPERWRLTLRSMLWTHATTVVSPFTGGTSADLPVPCTFDFNVAATKYFAGLENGEVPLCLLFSGTIFYQTDHGLQVAQIPWDREATFRLPVQVWHDLMEEYYPNSAWLSLRKDVFDRLHAYKRRQGLATWEEVLQMLLPVEEGAASP
jgi:hypothetical protein